ncbi:MAG: IclR family transcriptional regulator [Phocaeicola sp.]
MKLNRTLLRAIEILEVVSKKKEGYTLAELAMLLESPKSSVFDIVKTLVFKGMLFEDNSRGITKYKVGLQSFLIGSGYLNNTDMVNVAKDDLIELANKMDATTFVAILDDNKVTYLYKYESENTIITTANIGSRMSVHSAALGKIMLAYSSDEVLSQTIKNTDFVPYTEYTITSVEKYLEVLKEARIKGYATNNREDTLQQVAAASALFDYTGKVVGAISCVGFYDSAINLDELGEIVKGVASNISKKMGYIENKL